MLTLVGTGPIAILQTEARNGNSSLIDVVSTLHMCRMYILRLLCVFLTDRNHHIIGIMNDNDATVAPSVKVCLPEVARTTDMITDRVRMGGRVLYIGAGTSGRSSFCCSMSGKLILRYIFS